MNNKRIGTVSIIVHSRTERARRVNEIISEHGAIVIGRLGLPYGPRGLNIIALIVDGSTDEIGALTGKLGALHEVEVKAALAKV
mgnify:CR=1 FL=1